MSGSNKNANNADNKRYSSKIKKRLAEDMERFTEL